MTKVAASKEKVIENYRMLHTYLTHLSRMEFPSVIIWTSALQF